MSINVTVLTERVKQIAANQTKRTDAILQAARETTVAPRPATPPQTSAQTREVKAP